MDLALFQPEIPQNAGTLLRLGACWNVKVHLIAPLGFAFSDRRLKRAGMDYIDRALVLKHEDWGHFADSVRSQHTKQRLVLLCPQAKTPYTSFVFQPDDILILGRESDGVPESFHQDMDQLVKIPMHPDCRSLNVALAGAIVLGEALRQTNQFPVV